MPIINDIYNYYHKKNRTYNGIKVSQNEENTINLLQKEVSFSNKYCKEQVATLFFWINKEFPAEVKTAQKKNVLSLCEDIVLRRLNYLPKLWKDEAELRQTIGNAALCQSIEKVALKIVNPLTGKEDRFFYSLHPDAWRIRYEHLTNHFDPKNIAHFYKEVCKLGELNEGKVAGETTIYMKAHQFLVKIDREYSLRFYIWSRLPSNSRQISARNRKLLFRNKDEEEAYDEICRSVHTRKDRIRALKQFEQLHITQRKRISLNADAIKRVAERQSKVAGVLSQLLAEDEELPGSRPQESGSSSKQKPEIDGHDAPQKQVPDVQNPADNPKEALFRLFITRSYTINKEELDIFARSYGLFPGQFIEQINDTHFEQLDDVLIEEEKDGYTLNQEYYQQVKENED